MAKEGPAEATIRNIKRKTRRKYSAEEKIRIVVDGLRGEETIAELCRGQGEMAATRLWSPASTQPRQPMPSI